MLFFIFISPSFGVVEDSCKPQALLSKVSVLDLLSVPNKQPPANKKLGKISQRNGESPPFLLCKIKTNIFPFYLVAMPNCTQAGSETSNSSQQILLHQMFTEFSTPKKGNFSISSYWSWNFPHCILDWHKSGELHMEMENASPPSSRSFYPN